LGLTNFRSKKKQEIRPICGDRKLRGSENIMAHQLLLICEADCPGVQYTTCQ